MRRHRSRITTFARCRQGYSTATLLGNPVEDGCDSQADSERDPGDPRVSTAVSRRHGQIRHSTLADGILDRLVHNAHRIEMRGDSMRKNRGKSNA